MTPSAETSRDEADADRPGIVGGLDPSRMHHAAAWRGVYLLAQGGLSILLFAGLARMLPPAGFAITATVQGVLIIAWSVGDLGLAQAAVSVLPGYLADRDEDRARALGGAAVAFFLAAAFALGLCCVAALFVASQARLAMLLIAPAAAATVLVSGADGLLRAQGDFRRPVVLVLLSRLGAFAAVLSAAVSPSADWACAAMSIGIAVGSIGSARFLGELSRSAEPAAVRAFVKAAIPLGVAQLFTVGGGRLNTLILSTTAGLRASAVFETTWRGFQLGQYVVGALATGWAPFLAAALGRGSRQEFRPLLRRSIGIVAVAGVVTGGLLFVLRHPLGHALAPAVGRQAGDDLTPLAIITPVSFLGFLVTFVVSASPHYRRYLLPAYGLGALLNIVLTLALSHKSGAAGAALASAAGICASTGVLLLATAHLASTPTEPSGASIDGSSA